MYYHKWMVLDIDPENLWLFNSIWSSYLSSCISWTAYRSCSKCVYLRRQRVAWSRAARGFWDMQQAQASSPDVHDDQRWPLLLPNFWLHQMRLPGMTYLLIHDVLFVVQQSKTRWPQARGSGESPVDLSLSLSSPITGEAIKRHFPVVSRSSLTNNTRPWPVMATDTKGGYSL